jgi:hypothetical protein
MKIYLVETGNVRNGSSSEVWADLAVTVDLLHVLATVIHTVVVAVWVNCRPGSLVAFEYVSFSVINFLSRYCLTGFAGR